MRRIFLTALAAASFVGLVAGCASSPYGSFLTEVAPAPFDGIASDAVRRLGSRWKPAKTRLVIQHTATDPFGSPFIGALRAQGYSVLESSNSPRQAGDPVPASDAADAVPLSYVVDRAGDLYRLKLIAGREVMSRAYVVNAGQFAPAGAWSVLRQE